MLIFSSAKEGEKINTRRQTARQPVTPAGIFRSRSNPVMFWCSGEKMKQVGAI
jgi:hypothetical protein